MLKVDVFVATTKEIKKGLETDGIPPDRIRFIPNFVDLQNFSPAPTVAKAKIKHEFGWQGKQVVSFSGRLVPRKGIEVLLEAWTTVHQQCPSSLLVIMGEGPQGSEYIQLAHSKGLSDSVLFLGQVANITLYLHATDVFVLPSFQEGLPNSLLEAMGCALPAVASRIGGVEDVIQTEINGLLVDPGRMDDLAQAVIRLLQNPEEAEQIGLEAARTIQEKYVLEEIVKYYIYLYQELSASEGKFSYSA